MGYLRFDLKNERKTTFEHDKFCLASSICIPFVENCQKAKIPNVFITVDEQLLPCKARCKFIQYMANKPDKFGLKFWIAADVESKYFYNGFPYLGKNKAISNDVSVSTDVVLKLIDPLLKKSYNVTCDNYFTSLPLSLKLAQNNCSLVCTIRHNRKEIPNILKTKRKLHDTVIVKSKEDIAVTITSCQCKKSKSVKILSTLHPSVSIPEENNPKKTRVCSFLQQNKVWDRSSRSNYENLFVEGRKQTVANTRFLQYNRPGSYKQLDCL